MKKQFISTSLLSLGLCAAIGLSVYAVPGSLDAPGGNNSGGNAPSAPGGQPGGQSNGQPGGSQSSASYSGATTISSDTSLSATEYKSTTGSENALLISGGTVNLENPTIEKSGDSSDENSDFYGTNAAVLVYNDATLNLAGGSVTTNGGHANGVFAYGSGIINLENTKITTASNNSGGIMVTGGGTLTAKNLTVDTAGNSSAAIRSDRGGGTMTITGGSYKTSGQGSPAIYSTADITVNDAELVSTASEGVVIEGLNSVTLNNVNLTDTNNTLNGNSETYKNIFIYQSMSGDAETGTGTFTAKDSTLTTNQGDTFFITNTTASITLENNEIVNNDASGAFLRAQAGKWGTSGSNGGQVTLDAKDQEIFGDIILDEISTLDLTLEDGSYYKGTINGANTAKNLSLKLSADSVIVLTGDTYLTSLENADETNMNIYLNGYKLYVEDVEVEGNTATPPEGKASSSDSTTEETSEDTKCLGEEGKKCSTSDDSNLWLILAIIAASASVIAIAGLIYLWYNKTNGKHKKDPSSPNSPTPPSPTSGPQTPPSSYPSTGFSS